MIDFAALNWATVSLCTQLKANKSVRSPPFFVFFFKIGDILMLCCVGTRLQGRKIQPW